MDLISADPVKKRTIPTPDEEGFLVTVKTLCQLLHLPEKWVRRMTTEGRLPAVRVGHRVLYKVAAVRKRLERMADDNQYGRLV